MNTDILACETRTYSTKTFVHDHDYGQLILPIQGSLSISTNNIELNLDEKNLFYLPPSCSHSFSSNNINQFLVLDIPREINPLLFENLSSQELHHILDDRWKAIRFLLQEESKRSNKTALVDLVNYACGFLTESTRPISIQYIHDNFEKYLSVKILSKIENFNESYYIDWFNKKTGLTPNAYIQNLRLKKAKEFLIHTDMSIIMIANSVGYEQQSSLTRLFKKHENTTPSIYRKFYRNMVK